MKELLKKIEIYGLKTSIRYIFIEFKKKLYNETLKKSFSQHGEDLVIDQLLNYKKRGMYVDIGAYDPNRFSNTKRFYLRGWRGINIEPNTKNYQKFLLKRPDDINLNIGIGNSNGKFNFYYFLPETLSTFSKKEATNYKKEGYELKEVRNIQVNKLKDILEKYKKFNKIDFMNIDTEGFEINVLKSNDWKKFRPKIICIESTIHSKTKQNKGRDDIHIFLSKKKYKIAYQNSLNSLYISY